MIKYSAELDNLPLFIEHACKYAEEAGLEIPDIARLELAVEESIVNIINYSFPEGGGYIEMECNVSRDSITIIISDNGLPFNPLAKEDPDLTVPLEDRKVGGLGIFLIKNLMDEVSYKREKGCNVLTMTKMRHKLERREANEN